MTNVRRVVLLLAITILAGCASSTPAPTRQLVTGTCGVALEFWWVEAAERRFEFFQVNDGTLGYGGGAAGLSRTPTWWVDLSPEQCAELASECRNLGWFTTPPQAVEEGTRVELTVRVESERGGWKVATSEPAMLQLKTWLDAVAGRRFDGVIQALPATTR